VYRLRLKENNMKLIFRCITTAMMVFCFLQVNAQDLNVQLKEAENFEKQLKEIEAIEKYKQILLTNPSNIKSLVKTAELNTILGSKEKDKKNKRLFYESALAFAQRALQADANSADANYAMAMASGKLTDVESENKKIVAFVKDVKVYADKAVAINPNHAKANYTLGKWHLEMVTLSGIKKMAVKLFYGGLPDGDLDKAISLMEKCKSIEPYFATNYLDLGKAYQEAHQPARAIEVLSKLIKLPTRTSEDIVIKAEGAKLLESLQ
jgi:tetratricopeptide (TPR) repeat protein